MSIKTFLESRPSRTKVDPLVPSHVCVYFSPIDYPLSQAVSSQWTALNATTAVAGFGWNGCCLISLMSATARKPG